MKTIRLLALCVCLLFAIPGIAQQQDAHGLTAQATGEAEHDHDEDGHDSHEDEHDDDEDGHNDHDHDEEEGHTSTRTNMVTAVTTKKARPLRCRLPSVMRQASVSTPLPLVH